MADVDVPPPSQEPKPVEPVMASMSDGKASNADGDGSLAGASAPERTPLEQIADVVTIVILVALVERGAEIAIAHAVTTFGLFGAAVFTAGAIGTLPRGLVRFARVVPGLLDPSADRRSARVPNSASVAPTFRSAATAVAAGSAIALWRAALAGSDSGLDLIWRSFVALQPTIVALAVVEHLWLDRRPIREARDG